MLAHLDLHAAHVHPVDIPRVPLSRRISILVGFVNQAHGHTALHRSDRRIGVPRIRNAVHDDVDLLRLLIHVQLSAIEEVLAAVESRRKVELGIDRKSRIIARQRAGDIAVIRVVDRVCPDVVILCLETLDQRDVAREIDRLVDVIRVWRRGNEEIRRKIRAGKLQRVLSDEEHHLPVQDAAAVFVTHRNSRGFELVQDLLVTRIGRIGPRIDENPHGNAGLVPGNDLVREGRVLHEPVGDIDAHGFLVNQLPERYTAVFESSVAKTLL